MIKASPLIKITTIKSVIPSKGYCSSEIMSKWMVQKYFGPYTDATANIQPLT